MADAIAAIPKIIVLYLNITNKPLHPYDYLYLLHFRSEPKSFCNNKRLIIISSTKVIDGSLFLIVCYFGPLDVPFHQTKGHLQSFQPLYPPYMLSLLHIELVYYGPGGVYGSHTLNRTNVLKYEYEKYLSLIHI